MWIIFWVWIFFFSVSDWINILSISCWAVTHFLWPSHSKKEEEATSGTEDIKIDFHDLNLLLFVWPFFKVFWMCILVAFLWIIRTANSNLLWSAAKAVSVIKPVSVIKCGSVKNLSKSQKNCAAKKLTLNCLI